MAVCRGWKMLSPLPSFPLCPPLFLFLPSPFLLPPFYFFKNYSFLCITGVGEGNMSMQRSEDNSVELFLFYCLVGSS